MQGEDGTPKVTRTSGRTSRTRGKDTGSIENDAVV